MPKRKAEVPSYRHHKASGLAFVQIDGKPRYLGKHGSPESKAKYAALVEKLASGQPPTTGPTEVVTVLELVAAFRRHAAKHYAKGGQRTSTVSGYDQAAKPLLALYAYEPVSDFGPLKLRTIQALMVKGFTDRLGKQVGPVSRGVVNKRIKQIRKIFKWGESWELAPAGIWNHLRTVDALERGRSEARETDPVLPVDNRDVEATLEHLPSIVADMVRIQRLTGCRPGEVCIMRPMDIDRTPNKWVYRPASHKTEHHGRARVIPIGPKVQLILQAYLLRASDAYCFSPAESESQRHAEMRANRQTPMTPSQARRRPKGRKFPAGTRYTNNSYRRAISRAIELADEKAHADQPEIPPSQRLVNQWNPNQLRHTAATEIRTRFGLEAAQVILGHSKADVTQVYAERDLALGLEVMRQIG